MKIQKATRNVVKQLAHQVLKALQTGDTVSLVEIAELGDVSLATAYRVAQYVRGLDERVKLEKGKLYIPDRKKKE
jgi:hypothetical protein